MDRDKVSEGFRKYLSANSTHILTAILATRVLVLQTGVSNEILAKNKIPLGYGSSFSSVFVYSLYHANSFHLWSNLLTVFLFILLDNADDADHTHRWTDRIILTYAIACIVGLVYNLIPLQKLATCGLSYGIYGCIAHIVLQSALDYDNIKLFFDLVFGMDTILAVLIFALTKGSMVVGIGGSFLGLACWINYLPFKNIL